MTEQTMTTEEIIVKLRMMARYPTVTLPRDTEALKMAADLLEQAAPEVKDELVIDESAAKRIATALGWEPKRTWVGLTAKDATQICIDCGCLGTDWLLLHSAIEAKLKDKNNG